MGKYQVEILETLRKIVIIEAETPDEAVEITNDNYGDGEFVLDYDDFIGVDFTVMGVENETEN